MDPKRLESLFRELDPHVWIVASGDDAKKSALVATFVSNASIVPQAPRFVVGLSKRHYTTEQAVRTGRMTLHLLREGQHDWLERFATSSGRDQDKFQGLAVDCSPDRAPVLAEAAAWFAARVEAAFDTGDRWLFLVAVEDWRWDGESSFLRVGAAMPRLPTETLARLAKLREQDAEADSSALAAWRRQGIPSAKVD